MLGVLLQKNIKLVSKTLSAKRSLYIATVNFNRAQDTIELIKSIRNTNLPNIKLLVLDNGSKKEDFTLLKNSLPKRGLELIRKSKNLGFAKGFNLLITKALKANDCEMLMIINNDTLLSRTNITDLVTYCNSNPTSMVSPLLIFPNRSQVQSAGLKFFWPLGLTLNYKFNQDPAQLLSEHLYPYALTGACIITSKTVWQKLGGFREDFFAYFEDLELGSRARKIGIQPVVLSNTQVIHKHSLASGGQSSYSYTNKKINPFKSYFLMRNGIKWARLHLNFIYRGYFLATHISGQLMMSLLVYRNLSIIPIQIRAVKDGFFNNFNPPGI